METFDLSPWVRSPAIRDHMKETWRPNNTQQALLVARSFCPLESKIKMLNFLRCWPDSEEERRDLKNLWLYYRFALGQIETAVPGEVYLLARRLAYRCRRGWNWRYAGIEAFPSWEAVQAYCRDRDGSRYGGGWAVDKYIPTEKGLEALIHFILEYIEGQIAVTSFWYEDNSVPQADFDARDSEIFAQAEELIDDHILRRRVYTLPFVTGDLAALDLPFFPTPLYGVYLLDIDGNGTPYSWFGCIRDGVFDEIDLSNDEINLCTDYRVMDWLRPAAPAELPPEEKILAELSAYIRALEDPREAEAVWGYVFSPYEHDGEGDDPQPEPYHKIPPTLEDLLSGFDPGEYGEDVI